MEERKRSQLLKVLFDLGYEIYKNEGEPDKMNFYRSSLVDKKHYPVIQVYFDNLCQTNIKIGDYNISFSWEKLSEYSGIVSTIQKLIQNNIIRLEFEKNTFNNLQKTIEEMTMIKDKGEEVNE